MLLDISSFWQELDTIQKIYWIIAIPSTVLFIIQLIITFLGFDHDSAMGGDSDLSVDGDHGIATQFFSVKNLVAFFTIFSWVGLGCLQSGLSISVSIIISLLSGTAMVVIMATIFYYMTKLTDAGNLEIKNAIHKIGTVYLTIPANRKAMGKVQVKVQGLQTLDALTDDNDDLKTGSVVEVVGIISDEILLVTRSK